MGVETLHLQASISGMVALKLALGAGGKWYQLMAFSTVAPHPNGAIRRTYNMGEPITAFRDRSGLAMTTFNGAPWLRTADNCLVRANTRFIQPTNLF
jgi:hypothetical protein